MPASFHPAVSRWLARAFEAPTPAQRQAWPQIQAGRQEVLDEILIVESHEQVFRGLAQYGTIEAVANMFYAQKRAEIAYRTPDGRVV